MTEVNFIRDMLIRLRSKFEDSSANTELNATLVLIRHMIDCVAELKSLRGNSNTYNPLPEATAKITDEISHGFLTELAKLVIYAVTKDWKLPEEASLAAQYLLVTEYVLDLFPEMAARKNKDNDKMLIHHICIRGSDRFGEGMLKAVVNAHFGSVSSADSNGALPIHWIMKNPNATISMLTLLILTHPAGLQYTDSHGLTPMHWAVNTETPNMLLITHLIEKFPNSIQRVCHKGWLPIHYAININKPNLDLIKLLVKEYPESIEATCREGYLPIHRLVDRPVPDIATLRYLIDSYPSGLRRMTSCGHLPIHRLLCHSSSNTAYDQVNSSYYAIQLLYERYPDCVSVADNEAYMPIHIVLSQQMPDIELVLLLLKAYPTAASCATRLGLFPLHLIIGCSTNPSIEVVRELVSLNPLCIGLAVESDPMSYPQGAASKSTVATTTTDEPAPAVSPVVSSPVISSPAPATSNPILWTPLTKAIERKLDNIVKYFFESLKLPGMSDPNSKPIHLAAPGVTHGNGQGIYATFNEDDDNELESNTVTNNSATPNTSNLNGSSSSSGGNNPAATILASPNLTLFGAAAACAVAAANANLSSLNAISNHPFNHSHSNYNNNISGHFTSSHDMNTIGLATSRALSSRSLNLGIAGSRRSSTGGADLGLPLGQLRMNSGIPLNRKGSLKSPINSRQGSGVPLSLLATMSRQSSTTALAAATLVTAYLNDSNTPTNATMMLSNNNNVTTSSNNLEVIRPVPKDPKPSRLSIPMSPMSPNSPVQSIDINNLSSLIQSPIQTEENNQGTYGYRVSISRGIASPTSISPGPAYPIGPGFFVPDPSDPLEEPIGDNRDKCRKKPMAMTINGDMDNVVEDHVPIPLIRTVVTNPTPEINLLPPETLPNLIKSPKADENTGNNNNMSILASPTNNKSSKMQLPNIKYIVKKQVVKTTPTSLYDEDGRKITSSTTNNSNSNSVLLSNQAMETNSVLSEKNRQSQESIADSKVWDHINILSDNKLDKNNINKRIGSANNPNQVKNKLSGMKKPKSAVPPNYSSNNNNDNK